MPFRSFNKSGFLAEEVFLFTLGILFWASWHDRSIVWARTIMHIFQISSRDAWGVRRRGSFSKKARLHPALLWIYANSWNARFVILPASRSTFPPFLFQTISRPLNAWMGSSPTKFHAPEEYLDLSRVSLQIAIVVSWSRRRECYSCYYYYITKECYHIFHGGPNRLFPLPRTEKGS